MKNKKKIVLFAAFAVVALFIGGAVSYNYLENERLGFLAQENSEVFVRDYAPRMGAKEPDVYLVEFLDPECESCRAFAPYVKELIKEYQDKVQLIVRYAPFHKNSKFAVKILEAARNQGKYWEVLDVLFRYQPNWGNHHNPQPELIWYYLPEAGVDVAKIREDMQDPAIVKRIEQDIADGQKLGVRGTPSFYINGAPLENFGRSQLKAAIQSAIEDS
tara:strand:+ start:1337 stop:1987 length:651 start_codon:yes stop_codon:yes gene_type:complete